MTMAMALTRRWENFWHAPMPAIRLEAFRQALLFSLVLYMVHRFMYAGEWLSTAGFHPSLAADRFNGPQLPLLSPGMVPLFGVALFGSLALALFDWLRRPATWLALALVLYATLVDPIAAFTLNRIYCFTLLVLAIAPAPPRPVAGGPEPTISAWPVRLLQLQLVLHYFASGVCKAVYGRWLTDSDLLWFQMQEVFMTDTAAYLVRTLPAWAFTAQQGLALGFELLAPLLLGVRRLRPLGILLGLGMHVFIAVNMHLLVYFSLQIMCFYLLFIEPAALQRARARLGL